VTEATSGPQGRTTSLRSHTHAILGGVVLALLAIAYRELLGWNPGRELGDEAPTLFVASNTSPLFIGSLSALFLYMRVNRLRNAWRHPAPSAWGWLLLIPASVILGWAHYTGARDILLLSGLPMILGAALVAIGPRFAGALLLPVLFLAFMYPTPAVIANQQVYASQILSAEFVTRIVDAFGIPVVRQGDLIYLRQQVFQVIETCSGLRLIETLVPSAFAYSEVMHTQRSHQIVLILLAPFLGFVLNAVRVLMIMFNPVADYASDHTLQGIIVVVVGVLTFSLIEKILKRFFPGEQSHPKRRRRPTSATSRPALSAVVVVATACAAASIWLPRWQPPTPERWALDLPRELDGWASRKQDNDEDFLGSVYFSRHIHRIYEKEDQNVLVFAARDDRNKRDRSLLSPKTALPGAGWQIVEEREIEADWTDGNVREIIATRRQEVRLIYHWYENTPGVGSEMLRSVLGLENSDLRLPTELRVFRVSASMGPSPEERKLAAAHAEQFARRLRASLDG
jgi:exosortase